ncbi:MAG: PIN domain-containing protein [Parcubacteria group bacterium]
MSKKEKAYFIDTNIFLRALINDNARKYTEVVAFLEAVKKGRYKACSSSVVLAEIIWTLLSYYKLSKTDVVKSIEGIVNLNGLTFIENQSSAGALDLYKTHNVKYIDCLIYSGLQKTEKDWVVVSYDTDFDKLGAERMEPKHL